MVNKKSMKRKKNQKGGEDLILEDCSGKSYWDQKKCELKNNAKKVQAATASATAVAREKATQAGQAAKSAASNASQAAKSAASNVAKKVDDAGRLTQSSRMSTKEEVITLGSFFLSVFKRCSEDQSSDIKYGNNFVTKMLTSIMPDTAPSDYDKWTIEGETPSLSFMLLAKIFASTERRDKKSYQTIINVLFEGESFEDTGITNNIMQGKKSELNQILKDSEEAKTKFDAKVNEYIYSYTALNGLRLALLKHMTDDSIEKSLSTELMGVKVEGGQVEGGQVKGGKRRKSKKKIKKNKKKSARRNRK